MMNKHKMRYVVDVLTREKYWAGRFSEAVNSEEYLKAEGFYDLLCPVERHQIISELMEIAEAESFRQRHELKVRGYY